MNGSSISDLKPGMLVRARCMVADMENPEYYSSSFDVQVEGARLTVCGALAEPWLELVRLAIVSNPILAIPFSRTRPLPSREI